MRRITAFALLSALFVSVLPLSASAEPDRPTPPPTKSFEELESCVASYAPKLYDYYKETSSSDTTWAPSFTTDQRNHAWVSKISQDGAGGLDATGELPDLPTHDEANAANPGTKSIVHYRTLWSEKAFDEYGADKWSTLCLIIAQTVTFDVQPAIVDLGRLSWIDGKPLRYSFAVSMTENAHPHDQDPSLVSRMVVFSAQAWVENPAGSGFADTPADHVFAADIAKLASSGITRGCNPPANTKFCPDDFVTRGQMAAFLVRALGLKSGKSTFADTKGHVFAADIAALADAGITKGCNPPRNDRFCPDDRVTRGQMAAFLTRALGLPSGKAAFKDTSSHVFAADVASLADAGITRGCNPPANDRFCPDQPVTRGQMAAFLVRAGLAG